MADRLLKAATGPGPGPVRQTMLMNTWFNFYGTVVSILDLCLLVMAFELIILSIVNDFNSSIHNDISYHYHYGTPKTLIFVSIHLFILSLKA